MFGNRRRRGSSNPPPINGPPPSASAATAAAQAFLKNQASNASLSSAAAAAALRSRPTTPISVADVQTKRMLRRSGSTSSMGSSVAGSTRPELERRPSNGSMSERTFRDPSPSRGVPSAIDAPPVPAIPKGIAQSNSHRRAASMEAPPARLTSPPPNKTNGRGSSLGPSMTSTPPGRNRQRMSSLSSVQELTGIERPGSRGSVNFSYPTNSRPLSPDNQRRLTSPSPSRNNTAARITSSTNQDLVYDPNTRSFLPLAQILAIEQRLYDAANQPVKKKKRIAPAQATGTHFAEGTVGGRPHGTAVDAMQSANHATRAHELDATTTLPTSISDPAPSNSSVLSDDTKTTNLEPSNPAPRKKKKRVTMATDLEADQASSVPNSSDNDSDVRPAAYNTKSGALLGKKPSIVREDREREEEEDTPHPAGLSSPLALDTRPRTISPSPLPRSAASRGHARVQAPASTTHAESRQDPIPSQPVPNHLESAATSGGVLSAKDSIRGDRVHSVSPARTAHFARTPDNLVVRHQPPPRSISPRKSALKQHANSPRGSSPASDMPGSAGNSKRWSISEASNASSVSDDLPIPRKKTVRVSFDERNVAVGEAAPQFTTDSPVAPSPQQAKRNWFSIGRGKKNSSIIEDEDDETMKPRPALPSFGSVRDRKHTREPVEERQLVKPAEPIETILPVTTPIPESNQPKSPAEATSPLFTNATGEVIEDPMGQSSDHGLGSILSQDAAAKNEANISKSREPLPPQVTSVEGSGYNSDSDSTVSGLETPKASDMSQTKDSYQPVIASSEQVEDAEDDQDDISGHKTNGDIPQIAISHPTPTLDDAEKSPVWPSIPGGFPDGSTNSDSESGHEIAPEIVEHHATDPTLAAAGISEPFEGHEPGSPSLGGIAADNHLRESTIIEESEDESIYSDAAEDLSDVDGDGFMSLDAVVESPVINNSTPGLAITTPPDSPTARSTKEKAYKKSQLSRKSSEPELDQGWSRAQDYWRGLSSEKKLQLERDAREEAEESDATIEAMPQPKPKKKKKKALVVNVPAQAGAGLQNIAPVRNDRTYMIQPGTKAQQDSYAPAIRSSMRQESPGDTHIRKSMRGQGAMRGSLRESEKIEPKGSLQKKYRPMSLPASEIKADPAAVNRHIRALSAAGAAAAPAAAKRDMAPPAPPQLRRKNSGDSDSSFKRTRPTGTSHFKSSMRRGSIEQPVNTRQQSPMGSGRFSLRSLSPTGSTVGRRPFNSVAPPPNQTHMRNSMRGSYDAAPTLRGVKPSRTKSPMRIPGFGRSSSKPVPQKPARQNASRFGDSSDEEDARPAFRSRFVDSSDDDDEPLPTSKGLRNSMRASQPVRAIPQRAGVIDGESSDLPDSDDERSPASPASPGKLAKVRPSTVNANGNSNGNNAASHQGATLATGSLRRSGSGRGTMAAPIIDPTMRPKQVRRGSLMSILRRKKVDPASKVRKSDIESAARRDTPLERSRTDLQAVRRQESYNSTNGTRPQSPKLQKRVNGASNWPLPASDDRPFTSEGEQTNGNGRPDLGTRRFTATGLADVDLSNVTGKARKKKKFQALRNLFGLDD